MSLKLLVTADVFLDIAQQLLALSNNVYPFQTGPSQALSNGYGPYSLSKTPNGKVQIWFLDAFPLMDSAAFTINGAFVSFNESWFTDRNLDIANYSTLTPFFSFDNVVTG